MAKIVHDKGPSIGGGNQTGVESETVALEALARGDSKSVLPPLELSDEVDQETVQTSSSGSNVSSLETKLIDSGYVLIDTRGQYEHSEMPYGIAIDKKTLENPDAPSKAYVLVGYDIGGHSIDNAKKMALTKEISAMLANEKLSAKVGYNGNTLLVRFSVKYNESDEFFQIADKVEVGIREIMASDKYIGQNNPAMEISKAYNSFKELVDRAAAKAQPTK